jgi:uncharacterized protein YbjT (DUF2867 family)
MSGSREKHASRRVVVFGASGGVGRHLVANALERGFSVRGVYRSPPQAGHAGDFDPLVAKDVTSPDTVKRAVEGCNALVSALGHRRANPKNPWSKVLSPRDLNTRFANSLVSVGLDAVPVVVVSAAGVGDSRARLALLLRCIIYSSNIAHAYRDLLAMEEILGKSTVDWTAVRATGLTDGKLQKNARICQRYGMFNTISRADVAHYMLDRLDSSQDRSSRTPMIT